MFLFWYMSGIQNFGTPYLAPYSPNISSDKKDALIKKSLQNLSLRPKSIPNKNHRRIQTNREKNK